MPTVDITDFCNHMAELFERDPGTVGEVDTLAEHEWSSLSVLGFLALMDRYYGVSLPTRAVAACTTVADLRRLVESAQATSGAPRGSGH